MDKPINGDKYVRTLSHYLRTNQRRLLPTLADSSPKSTTSPARSLVTPSDPMAAVYSGMVNSLWSVGSAVVSTITPSGNTPPPSSASDRDAYTGAWDGTGSIPADANPRERQLYLQAQLKAPIFPLDLYYLLYLLDRFEQVGIEVDGWDGSTPRTVGDSNPRVLGNTNNTTSTYSSFPPPTASARPQSIRSFSSTALSTLTLITGWKQWSSAATNNTSITINDDIHFIHKFLKKITGLRLVAKIPPGMENQAKGRIEGYAGDAILSLFSGGSSPSLLLPLAGTFQDLTHLELHKIPPRCIEGWETLMAQLKSLVVIQAGIEDVYDVIVTAVVSSERRRRQRVYKEKNRAVLIKQEQREALKDAAQISQQQRHDSAHSIASSTSSGSLEGSSSSGMDQSYADADDKEILNSIKMWPMLRHLSVSDNALPGLAQSETFAYSQAIITLDLSHNLFLAPPPALIQLHNLHSLNLSYNMINSVQSIYQILGNIAVLDLRSNRLESLCGLERLWNLEKVDVRENHLDEAAEIGRLAALPGIREIWTDRNPFCTSQPKYRLEILAVFKANGHELLLDGTFASFTEKRSLANMSPTSFSTTLSSINNVNLAHIPAASAPSATFAKDLNKTASLVKLSPSQQQPSSTSSPSESAPSGSGSGRPKEPSRTGSAALLAGSSGQLLSSPTNKLVKKKLAKSSKRVKRIVNLDSDHDEEEGHHSDCEHEHEHAHEGVLAPPAEIGEKKKKTKKKTTKAKGGEDGEAKSKAKKKGTKKKSAPENNGVSFADHDGSHEGGDHHVHRVAQLEQSMEKLTHHHNHHHNGESSSATSPRPKSILKRPSVVFGNGEHEHEHDAYGYLHPSSPRGSISSTSSVEGFGGADGYRRKIEAMRNEAGSNWLKVLAEMEGDGSKSRD
ncbi:hypothetical protein BG000_009609 [Podila horticola]|nr:hypothetical protein BG000_009609 [Podila horticola]